MKLVDKHAIALSHFSYVNFEFYPRKKQWRNREQIYQLDLFFHKSPFIEPEKVTVNIMKGKPYRSFRVRTERDNENIQFITKLDHLKHDPASFKGRYDPYGWGFGKQGRRRAYNIVLLYWEYENHFRMRLFLNRRHFFITNADLQKVYRAFPMGDGRYTGQIRNLERKLQQKEWDPDIPNRFQHVTQLYK